MSMSAIITISLILVLWIIFGVCAYGMLRNQVLDYDCRGFYCLPIIGLNKTMKRYPIEFPKILRIVITIVYIILFLPIIPVWIGVWGVWRLFCNIMDSFIEENENSSDIENNDKKKVS